MHKEARETGKGQRSFCWYKSLLRNVDRPSRVQKLVEQQEIKKKIQSGRIRSNQSVGGNRGGGEVAKEISAEALKSQSGITRPLAG